MSEQKVVICQDLKAELQAFLADLDYDKLFVLTDTHTVGYAYGGTVLSFGKRYSFTTGGSGYYG